MNTRKCELEYIPNSEAQSHKERRKIWSAQQNSQPTPKSVARKAHPARQVPATQYQLFVAKSHLREYTAPLSGTRSHWPLFASYPVTSCAPCPASASLRSTSACCGVLRTIPESVPTVRPIVARPMWVNVREHLDEIVTECRRASANFPATTDRETICCFLMI